MPRIRKSLKTCPGLLAHGRTAGTAHEPAAERRAADSFAAAFLMPETKVLAKIRELGTIDAKLLAPAFGVSVTAMQTRLREIGIERGWALSRRRSRRTDSAWASPPEPNEQAFV